MWIKHQRYIEEMERWLELQRRLHEAVTIRAIAARDSNETKNSFAETTASC